MSKNQRLLTDNEAGTRPAAASESNFERPRRSVDISLHRVLAGALAAASAAFASSYLGLAGTVLGALVVSLVASVATAVYTPPLERSRDAIHRGSQVLLETLPIAPRSTTYVHGDPVTTRVLSPQGVAPAASTAMMPDEVDATAFQGSASSRAEAPGRSKPSRLDWSNGLRRWQTVLVTAVVTVIAGLGVLTGVELMLGQSAGSITGHGSGGTTIGDLIPGNSSPARSSHPTKSPSSPTPSGPTGTDTSAGAPTSAAPTSVSPSTAAPTTTAPTTTAPTTTAPTTTAPTTPTTTTPTTRTPRPGSSTTGIG